MCCLRSPCSRRHFLSSHPFPVERESSPGLEQLAQENEAWVRAQPGRPWLDPGSCASEAGTRDPEDV